MSKVYRTIIQYEILSPTPLEDYLDLEAINDACINGDCSGKFLENPVSNEEIHGDAAIELIKSHGNDPEFFGLPSDEE